MPTEAHARTHIDALLQQAGWGVCDLVHANLGAALGVAIREFPLKPGHGVADYLLYVKGKACGVIEAKRPGATLKGVEIQSAKYSQRFWGCQAGYCIHCNQTFLVRMDLDAMTPKLGSWWGNTDGKEYFFSVGTQTTKLKSINFGSFSEFPAPEQLRAGHFRLVQEIERFLSVVDEAEADVDANLRRAEALRHAVLVKFLV